MAKQQEKFVLRPRDYLLVHNTTDHVVKTSEGAVGQRYNLRFFVNPGEAILIRGKHFAHTGLDRAWDRGEVHVHRLDLQAMETVLNQQVINHNGPVSLKHAQVVHMLNRERCIISTHPLLQPVLEELCITIGQDLIVIDEDTFNEQHAEGGTSEGPAEDSQGPEAAGSAEAAGTETGEASGPDHATEADVPTGSAAAAGRGAEPEGADDTGGSPEVQGGSDAPDASGADAGGSGTGDGSSEGEDLGDPSEDAEREEGEAVDDGRSLSSDSGDGGAEAEGAAGSESGAGEADGETDTGSDSASGRDDFGASDETEAPDDGGSGEDDAADDSGGEPEQEPEVKEKPKASTKKKKAGRAKKKRN